MFVAEFVVGGILLPSPLALYYKYERDTEIRYADDVIMVDKDTDATATSDDNVSSTKKWEWGIV